MAIRARRRRPVWPRGRSRPAGVLLALIVAAALAYSRWHGPAAAPGGTDDSRYDNQVAVCTQVVDGDTLHVNIPDGTRPYTRVRLWGVDAPELARGSAKPMHYGPEAHEFVRRAVDGRKVRIVLAPEDTRDRYGRLLAYVYYADPEEMLNEQLIAEGLAYADSRFPHPWREKFAQAETRARRARRGLWASVVPEAMPEWRRRRELQTSEPQRRAG